LSASLNTPIPSTHCSCPGRRSGIGSRAQSPSQSNRPTHTIRKAGRLPWRNSSATKAIMACTASATPPAISTSCRLPPCAAGRHSSRRSAEEFRTRGCGRAWSRACSRSQCSSRCGEPRHRDASPRLGGHKQSLQPVLGVIVSATRLSGRPRGDRWHASAAATGDRGTDSTALQAVQVSGHRLWLFAPRRAPRGHAPRRRPPSRGCRPAAPQHIAVRRTRGPMVVSTSWAIVPSQVATSPASMRASPWAPISTTSSPSATFGTSVTSSRM